MAGRNGIEWRPPVLARKRMPRTVIQNLKYSLPGSEDNQTLTINPVDVYALVNVAEGFKSFDLFYGIGDDDPQEWNLLAGPFDSPRPSPDRLVTWDASQFAGNMVTFRIVLHGQDENYADKRIHVILDIRSGNRHPNAGLKPRPSFQRLPRFPRKFHQLRNFQLKLYNLHPLNRKFLYPKSGRVPEIGMY